MAAKRGMSGSTESRLRRWRAALTVVSGLLLLALAGLAVVRIQRFLTRPRPPAQLPAEGASLLVRGLLAREGIGPGQVSVEGSPEAAVIRATAQADFPMEAFRARLAAAVGGAGYVLSRQVARGTGDEREDEFVIVPASGPGPSLTLIVSRMGPTPGAQRTPPREEGPKAAIVIDDIGLNLEMTRRIIDLPAPLTLSVMPGQPASESSARLAARHGREVMMHLPMEPLDFPEKDPGPGALMAGMNVRDMTSLLERDLATVPGIVGINNHMGSRLTADAAAMEQFMKWMAGTGLIFLDSRTAPDSVAYLKAEERGLKTLKRDVFLDNVDDREEIAGQLEELISISRARGKAVGIGHPRENTLAALAAGLDRFKAAGITIVPVSELAR